MFPAVLSVNSLLPNVSHIMGRFAVHFTIGCNSQLKVILCLP